MKNYKKFSLAFSLQKILIISLGITALQMTDAQITLASGTSSIIPLTIASNFNYNQQSVDKPNPPLNISDLKTGMYLMITEMNDDSQKTIKITKNNA